MKVVNHQLNEYVIRAKERNSIVAEWHEDSGFTEADDTIERSSVVALQVHSGRPMEAWNIVLKEL